MENRFWKLLFWCGPNILLPLTPLGLKMLINIFSTTYMSISESPELILYSFFTCLILNKMLSDKKAYFEKFLRVAVSIWLVIDLLILFIIYMNLNNLWCTVFAIITSVTIPFIAVLYKNYLLLRGDSNE